MAKIPFKRTTIQNVNEESTLNHEHNSEDKVFDEQEEKELQNLINEELGDSNDPTFMKNVKDQKTVSLDETKSSSKESKTINFMDEAAVSEYTASESKKSENTQNKDPFKGKSSDDIRNELKAEEERSKNQYTPDEMKEFASFIILLIDTIFSNALRWWSKDTSVTAYSLSKPSQDKLTKSLTYILIKYQAKFSIEWMFFITLIFMYAPPFLAANARRKDVMKAEQQAKVNAANAAAAKLKKQSEVKTTQTTTTNNDVIEPEVVETPIEPEVLDGTPKRKNSRPRRVR